jgi:hypothetical protein
MHIGMHSSQFESRFNQGILIALQRITEICVMGDPSI